MTISAEKEMRVNDQALLAALHDGGPGGIAEALSRARQYKAFLLSTGEAQLEDSGANVPSAESESR